MKRDNKNKILPLTAAILAVAGVLFFQIFSGNNFVFAADSISEIESKISKEEAAKAKLEQELGSIQKSVNSTQYEIQRTEALIRQAEENIVRSKKELELASERINLQKESLRSLIQEFYYNQKIPILYSMLNEDDLSKVFSEADHIITLNQKVYDAIEDIKQSKIEIENKAKSIEETKQDHEKLLDLKQDQKQDLLTDKVDTQQDIAKKEATIGELQAELSKLKSNLSGYLGKAYNAKDVQDAASFAAKASGVRKDFILGMLVVESNLGRFTGGCSAKDSRMSGTRLKTFQGICEELGYSWKTRKVSCPPRSYKGTGGAMGVAQFMPDTWTGYKSSIASKTGHNPPDPWNLTDGVMAMGLKLARGGATSRGGECNAAKLYLSGTTSSKYKWYCDRVLYWADNYEAKLGG
ncbi:MAG: lytic murein transglycosylase [Patescibacteria group bacterium]